MPELLPRSSCEAEKAQPQAFPFRFYLWGADVPGSYRRSGWTMLAPLEVRDYNILGKKSIDLHRRHRWYSIPLFPLLRRKNVLCSRHENILQTFFAYPNVDVSIHPLGETDDVEIIILKVFHQLDGLFVAPIGGRLDGSNHVRLPPKNRIIGDRSRSSRSDESGLFGIRKAKPVPYPVLHRSKSDSAQPARGNGRLRGDVLIDPVSHDDLVGPPHQHVHLLVSDILFDRGVPCEIRAEQDRKEWDNPETSLESKFCRGSHSLKHRKQPERKNNCDQRPHGNNESPEIHPIATRIGYKHESAANSSQDNPLQAPHGRLGGGEEYPNKYCQRPSQGGDPWGNVVRKADELAEDPRDFCHGSIGNPCSVV